MSKKNFKCAHIADIHFRGLSRHDQYRDSFTDFFSQMEKEEPDVIFVGGDIVHSKTQGISPELIEILTWWFKRLSEVTKEVVVILGNHDGLILNKNRQDAISPILQAMNVPNIKLYKDSGTYASHIPGYNFCVFSCFDEEGWENVKPVPGEINIAAFHGSVVGSLTDIDWELDGEVEKSFFDAFDFAFLGDIHKTQFLDVNDRIAYPGSTIQQNFGESAKKGYLLWEINDRDDFKVEFREVRNRSPFITIDWRGTPRETIDHHDLPQGSRVRVQSDRPIDQTSWMHFRNYLKKNYRVNEIVYDPRRALPSTENLKKADSEEGTHEDFRSINVLAERTEDWLKAAGATEKEQKAALDYMRSIHDQLPAPDTLRNVRWHIDSLKFDNTFAYGEGNLIDFNELKGVVGLFGKNRAGKSSIPGTMMYSLFNGSDRGSLKNLHIVNVRKDYCQASADFTVNGRKYRAERQTTKRQTRAGTTNAATHLNLFELDESGEVVKDLSGEQRRDTDKILRGLIGDSSSFTLTSFASQGAMNNFIREKATNRKAILTSFLDFDIFDDLNKIARQDLLDIKAKMSEMPVRDFESREQEINVELTRSKKSLKEAEKEKREASSLLENVQERLSELPSDIVTKADVEAQQAVVNKLHDTSSKLVEGRKQYLEEYREKKQKLSSLDELLSNHDPTKIEEEIESARKLIRENEKLKNLISSKRQNEKLLNRNISALDDVPCGDMFPSCKFIASAHESKKELKELRGFVAEIQEKLSDLGSVDESHLESLKDRLHKIKKIIKKRDALESEINNFAASSKLYEQRKQIIEEKIEFENRKLQKLQSEMSSEPVDEVLDELKQEKRELEQTLKTLEKSIIKHAQAVGMHKEQLKTLRRDRKRFESLNAEWKVVELIASATSKKGIPLTILSEKLPIVNAEISQILQGSTGFTVELEADPNSNAMDIFINYGDSRRVVECGSGMEKMMASLAIRVALMNLTNLPRCDMLIIDEGFGALDPANIEACNSLLQNLKKWFRTILVISHVEAVKDSVDNVIEISKVGQDSYVNTAA